MSIFWGTTKSDHFRRDRIYPKELEVLLDDQPGVLSAVIGVPHPDLARAPSACLFLWQANRPT